MSHGRHRMECIERRQSIASPLHAFILAVFDVFIIERRDNQMGGPGRGNFHSREGRGGEGRGRCCERKSCR